MLGLGATLLGAAVLAWLLHGGLGAALRGAPAAPSALTSRELRPLGGPHLLGGPHPLGRPRPSGPVASTVEGLAALTFTPAALLLGLRTWARRRRRYVRLTVQAYRADRTSVEGVVSMYEALHKRLQQRWWRRLLAGQPSVALEVHHVHAADGTASAVLAVSCPAGLERVVEAAVRSAYPNSRLATPGEALGHGLTPARTLTLVRLKKHACFIKRVKQLDRWELAREPPVDRLINVMGACGQDAFVQLALTPAPATFERYAKWRYKRHEDHLSRERREHVFVRDRSHVEEAELRGGLEVQHRPLYFADLRVAGPTRQTCERIASELRAEGAENRLVERGTAVRHGLCGLYARRVARGEGNPVAPVRKGVYASTELAAVWHLPSVEYAAVPIARGALPWAPAPPAILRPRSGAGLLRDALGPVSLHPQVRRQNTAVPGAVDQGKSSYLAATVAEDLRRERTAVVVLDPKGDAAEAAVSLVPPERTCTLLDFAHPTCGFNPLAVEAPADTIADYVVGALKQLFSDADIRASSDRYLRNAIIAVLAHDPRSTLWDAARLLSVGEEGYAYRARVGAHVRTLPQYREIAQFFTAELAAQLADSRSTTTAKLDAPVNKLARLLNSPSIKRVLLNESLAVDLDRVVAGHEVLVVKGAMGSMGAGNTSVLMQLLVGMLDAALARQQDTVPEEQRVAVALKVDEAPLVLNRGFAETLALKRSAGLETVACWQTDAQWTDREVREQLDALFAHRVYFATASARDARAAASLMMAEYSDTVRPEVAGLAPLARPDARLHLPRHHAIVSWCTPEGRQAPFVAQTVPLRVDPERLALHAARQAERGGRYLADLSQPHWERAERDRREARQEPRREGDGRESGGIVRVSGEGDRARARGASVPRVSGGEGNRGREAGGQRVVWPEDTAGGAEAAARSQRVGADQEAYEPLPGAAAESRAGPVGGDDANGSPGTAGETVGLDGANSFSASTARNDVELVDLHDTRWALPESTAESYAELIDLDAAHRLRWARAVASPRPLEPDPLDLEILALVAAARHVLTTQIHRRFNPKRALTTTQRRLKRLSDAALVERFQFHRRDGGGAPMCYVIAPRGLELLAAHGRVDLAELEVGEERDPSPQSSSSPSSPASPRSSSSLSAQPSSSSRLAASDRRLRQARHDVHVTGWTLALERALGGSALKSRGPEESTLSPPLRSTPAGRVAIGPSDLRLPGGRAPHDFLRTDSTGARVEVERFETVRPDASIELPSAPGGGREGAPVGGIGVGGAGGAGAAGVCLLVELDDRLSTRAHPSAVAKLERYDHLLAGWSVCAPRFAGRPSPSGCVPPTGRGGRVGASLLVVFLCRDRPRARECARRADHVLSACRAYAGEHPWDWEYPGREAVVFAAERDVHEGLGIAYGVPRLPPNVRAAAGGPGAREATIEAREILPGLGQG
jgi:hypothetical protein